MRIPPRQVRYGGALFDQAEIDAVMAQMSESDAPLSLGGETRSRSFWSRGIPMPTAIAAGSSTLPASQRSVLASSSGKARERVKL